MWFFRKRPTALEVMEAILEQVFTPEELEAMYWELKLENDRGFKGDMLEVAQYLRPKYSIRKSVGMAKKYVCRYRRDLRSARAIISDYFVLEIFEERV